MVRKDFPRFFQWLDKIFLVFFQWQDKIFLVFSPKIESFCRTGHWNWALAAFAIITLPGLAIIIGLVGHSHISPILFPSLQRLDDPSPSRGKYFWWFLTVLAYPTIILKTYETNVNISLRSLFDSFFAAGGQR